MRVTIVQCRMLRDLLGEASYADVAEQSNRPVATVYRHGQERCSHAHERARLGDTSHYGEPTPPRTMTDVSRILADESVTSVQQARERAAAMRGED